jgi:hypothetical protein
MIKGHKIAGFHSLNVWDVTLCDLVQRYQCFGETYYFPIKSTMVERYYISEECAASTFWVKDE